MEKQKVIPVTPERTLFERAVAESMVEEPPASLDWGEIDPRVLAGVRLLDTKNPGWARKINLERFDITNGDRCTLGQVYGSYSTGEMQLGIKSELGDERDSARFGFYSHSGGSYTRLQQDWLKVIGERQRLNPAPDAVRG